MPTPLLADSWQRCPLNESVLADGYQHLKPMVLDSVENTWQMPPDAASTMVVACTILYCRACDGTWKARVQGKFQNRLVGAAVLVAVVKRRRNGPD